MLSGLQLEEKKNGVICHRGYRGTAFWITEENGVNVNGPLLSFLVSSKLAPGIASGSQTCSGPGLGLEC